MGTSPAIIRLSLGLAILFGLVIVVWYELIRSMAASQVARRRRNRNGAEDNPGETGPQEAELTASEQDAAGQKAAEESELDRARTHFDLARKAARAERDRAIESANEATAEAIERIERRYREIDGQYIEETERILEMLRLTAAEKTHHPDNHPDPG